LKGKKIMRITKFSDRRHTADGRQQMADGRRRTDGKFFFV
jgi:hypothetical protein